jgi:hypothetical protein
LFFWPLSCLSFYLRLLITPLVFSNFWPLCCLSFFCWPLCCLSFFCWPLCCLSFFYLRFLITSFVSSNLFFSRLYIKIVLGVNFKLPSEWAEICYRCDNMRDIYYFYWVLSTGGWRIIVLFIKCDVFIPHHYTTVTGNNYKSIFSLIHH